MKKGDKKVEIFAWIYLLLYDLLLTLLYSVCVMWCWNSFMPELGNFSKITYLQALGLRILCSCLLSTYNFNNKMKKIKKFVRIKYKKLAHENTT